MDMAMEMRWMDAIWRESVVVGAVDISLRVYFHLLYCVESALHCYGILMFLTANMFHHTEGGEAG